jgi:hypothetical protein
MPDCSRHQADRLTLLMEAPLASHHDRIIWFGCIKLETSTSHSVMPLADRGGDTTGLEEPGPRALLTMPPPQ